ncbi:MAG TPA: thiamine diphosphokinase [Candidatus Limnocylindria bacterium]|jgi:thiamine pyrophosphokinase
MRAVLVAAGEPDLGDERWLDLADLLVAVDGGANWIERQGRLPHALVGDLDSVEPALLRRYEAAGVEIERHPSEKDHSDAELAQNFARRRGADEMVMLGAFGGPRIDHQVANVLLLCADGSGGMTLVCGPTRLAAIRGGETREITAPPGTLVSLFPVAGDANGVTTAGLRYALSNDLLRMGSSRGLSNVVESAPASVRLEAGMLLLVEQLEEGEMHP